MPVVYLGGHSVGGAIPGAASVLASVGGALEGLRSTVQAQLGAVQSAASSLSAQIDALTAAKAAIRIPAVTDFELQLGAALDLIDGFQVQVGDPITYINGLLSGLAQVSANLSALVPPDLAIVGQLAATQALAAQIELKIEAVDVQLAVLDGIVGVMSAIVSAVAGVQAALSAAAASVAGALSSYVALSAKIEGTAGAHCFLYTGNLGDLGTAVDAIASGSTGIAVDVPVRVPIVVVRADDVATNEGIDAIFRVS